MGKQHLKRLACPATWPIKRKGIVYITRPRPGAHSMVESMPLSTIFTELLHLANHRKEVRHLLFEVGVQVDGTKRKDVRIPVGLLDVVSLGDKHYRVSFNKLGKLSAFLIDAKEATQKIVRIKGKSVIKKGKLQLNFNDGSNSLVDKDTYKVGDSVVIELPGRKVKDHLPFGKKSTVLLVGGKQRGAVGTIEEVGEKTIIYKTRNGEQYETLKQYGFVVGKGKPVIQIQGEEQ